MNTTTHIHSLTHTQTHSQPHTYTHTHTPRYLKQAFRSTHHHTSAYLTSLQPLTPFPTIHKQVANTAMASRAGSPHCNNIRSRCLLITSVWTTGGLTEQGYRLFPPFNTLRYPITAMPYCLTITFRTTFGQLANTLVSNKRLHRVALKRVAPNHFYRNDNDVLCLL